MFKNLVPLAKVGVILLAILVAVLLILLPRACKAQTVVPVADCCSQLIDYKARYERVSLILDSTRVVGDRIIKATDLRIAAALKTANSQIGVLQKRNDELATKNETLAARLDECGSEKQTADEKAVELTGKVAKLEAKLKPKFLVRVGRTVRDGLAYIGGAAVIVGTLTLTLR